MIDYNSLPLDEILLEFDKFYRGEVKKKDILEKYGLNQNSLTAIKKIKKIS